MRELVRGSELQRTSALIRFYFHEDTDKMSADEYLRAQEQLYYALERLGLKKP